MISVTFAAFVLVICLFLLWRGKQYTIFKELGIPGPEPNFLFGNLHEIWRKGLIECHREWIQKYGRVVGYYVFGSPVVVVADVDLLRKIQISDFQKFRNRPFTVNPSKDEKEGLFVLQLTNFRDKRWKDIRNIQTPSFTASKMRTMAPLISTASDELLENIEKKAKGAEQFDMYKLYQALTMDVIGRTAFGVKCECQKNPKDPLFKAAHLLVSSGMVSYFFMATITLPALSRYFGFLARIPLILMNGGKDPWAQMYDLIREVIDIRRKNPSNKREDLLQLMIDAKMSESDMEGVTDSELTTANDNVSEEKQNTVTSEGKYKSDKALRSMDDGEIMDGAALFFLAGYETTSTALAFVTHLLVHYPEVQEKLREEINDLLKREAKLDYNTVSQLQYMDQVFFESLRLFPPVYNFVNRETAEDVDLGTLRLKKGIMIQVPVHYMHHDPELWEDPEDFDPNRFSPENKKKQNALAFQAFGAGPRNCIGMRFAQMESKIALAKVLQKYRLMKCEKTDTMPPYIKPSPAIYAPGKGVYLKAIPL